MDASPSRPIAGRRGRGGRRRGRINHEDVRSGGDGVLKSGDAVPMEGDAAAGEAVAVRRDGGVRPRRSDRCRPDFVVEKGRVAVTRDKGDVARLWGSSSGFGTAWCGGRAASYLCARSSCSLTRTLHRRHPKVAVERSSRRREERRERRDPANSTLTPCPSEWTADIPQLRRTLAEISRARLIRAPDAGPQAERSVAPWILTTDYCDGRYKTHSKRLDENWTGM